ncbi:MAG: IS630 family transposase [Acidobacteriota bacterium]
MLEQKELALLIFADEAGFSLHPRLGRVWALRGSKPQVPTTSHHQKRLNLFGWVEPLYGWHGLFRWPKGNRAGFLAFLKYLCHKVRGWNKIYLYVDKASFHRGSEVDDFLTAHPEIELEYLPPYHPELNPQERVWRMIRYEVTTNQYFETIDLIEQAIRKRQRQWRSRKIRPLCQVI